MRAVQTQCSYVALSHMFCATSTPPPLPFLAVLFTLSYERGCAWARYCVNPFITHRLNLTVLVVEVGIDDKAEMGCVSDNLEFQLSTKGQLTSRAIARAESHLP